LGTTLTNRDEMLTRVKRWGFLEFVETLPEGFDTVLGEHGARLSGGQRQRLAIARALLRQPSILLLDEATSALDTESEEKILQAIQYELPKVTVVMVSHRITSVRSADQIVVINDGRVVEQGTHETLVAGSGLYRYYAERQFGIS
jgi:ATP-binding cassette subfamily B protein